MNMKKNMKKKNNSRNKNAKTNKNKEQDEHKVIIHISDRESDEELNYDDTGDIEGFIFDDEDY